MEVDFAKARQAMVARDLRARGIRDERLLAAFERVPREEFIPAENAQFAYADGPLPIGSGQTISQPYIVAVMLDALALTSADRVLEIGTGSGYETALLCEMAAMVYTVERHAALSARACGALRRLGYTNVACFVGDGTRGLPAFAPYSAIAVSAAAPAIPDPLARQLADGGRMILPVGNAEVQTLVLARRVGADIVTRPLEGCRFVPLIGRDGFQQD